MRHAFSRLLAGYSKPLSTDHDAELVRFGAPIEHHSKFAFYEDAAEAHTRLLREGVDGEFADYSLEHELQHRIAAKLVGVESVRYCVRINTTAPQAALELANAEIPRLAYASILAAPDTPSPGDLRTLRSIGYRNISVASERIARWNEEGNGLPIPMPLGI